MTDLLELVNTHNALVAGGLATGIYVVCSVLSFARSYHSASVSAVPGVPKVPSYFPVGGAWVLAMYDKIGALRKAQDWYGDKEHGIFYLQAATDNFLVPFHHESLKALFSATSHHFPPGRLQTDQNLRLMTFLAGSRSVLGQDGGEHEKWLQARRLMNRSFAPVATKALVPHMSRVHKRFRQFLSNRISKQPNRPIDLQALVSHMTFDVFGECALSHNFKALECHAAGGKSDVLRTFDSLVQGLNARTSWNIVLKPWLHLDYLWLPFPANRRLKALKKRLRDFMSGVIRERREVLARDPSAKFDDILQTMIDARDPESGVQYEELQLLGNMTALLAAGYETTSGALTFALYGIAAHPRVQKKIQEEVDALLSRDGDLDDNTFRELEYTRNVFKEALRMYVPAVAFPRVTDKDVTIGKFTFPKGTQLLVPVHDAMHHPHNFKDPDTFKPERFEEPVPTFAYLPFMHGLRTCVGQAFAEMSSVLFLATLCRSFELSVPSDYEFKVVAPGLTVRPQHDLRLLVKERI